MKTRETLERWIAARGDWPGALFVTMGKGCRQRERLTYDGLYAVVRELGRKVGVQCHPHGFRHTAASEIARLTHGNVKWGMALTRHADPKTFMAYDDTRAKNMRQASELLVRGAYFRTEPQATDN
jgi:integrase